MQAGRIAVVRPQRKDEKTAEQEGRTVVLELAAGPVSEEVSEVAAVSQQPESACFSTRCGWCLT